MIQKPSSTLLLARRVVDGFPDLELVHDLTWFGEGVNRWGLCVDVRISPSDAQELPDQTRWWVVIDSAYPWGQIDVFPDTEHGTEKTFHHQSRNTPSELRGIPWRKGKICFWQPYHIMGRRTFVSEPIGQFDRLEWVFTRLREWVRCAANGTLIEEGEPFELPDFCANAPLVAFSESITTFETWLSIEKDYGIADILRLLNGGSLIVREFRTVDGRYLMTPRWGTIVLSAQNQSKAIWLLLDALPVLPPFRAPATWGELRAAVQKFRVSLDACLEKALSVIRDGLPHLALIGFPIPREYGPDSSPKIMHWQALLLPTLSRGQNYRDGFRANAKGYWMKDKEDRFRDEDPIQWLMTANWHEDQLAGRGRFDKRLCSRRVAIIGGGAVGSVLAELLVRGGFQDLLIVDSDIFETGNLVRHTLGMISVGKRKAEALAAHLNQLSPHARAEGISENFPNHISKGNKKKLTECDIIFDCSGADNVLRGLAEWEWNEDTIFFSISLGFGAERLYLVSGSSGTDFMSLLEEAFGNELNLDKQMLAEAELPTEATGCWHPLFPARIDRIWALIAVIVGHIEKMLISGEIDPAILLKATDGQVTVESKGLA